MMKSISRVAFLFSLLFLFSSQVMADEEITPSVYFDRAGMKVLSGVANVATGWVELPKNVYLEIEKPDGSFVDFVVGIVKGCVHSVGRTASGAIDFATFWLPTRPHAKPPFIWDDFSKETSYDGYLVGW